MACPFSVGKPGLTCWKTRWKHAGFPDLSRGFPARKACETRGKGSGFHGEKTQVFQVFHRVFQGPSLSFHVAFFWLFRGFSMALLGLSHAFFLLVLRHHDQHKRLGVSPAGPGRRAAPRAPAGLGLSASIPHPTAALVRRRWLAPVPTPGPARAPGPTPKAPRPGGAQDHPAPASGRWLAALRAAPPSSRGGGDTTFCALARFASPARQPLRGRESRSAGLSLCHLVLQLAMPYGHRLERSSPNPPHPCRPGGC